MTSAAGDPRSTIDSEHLRLLSIFHFVAAGLGFCGVAFSSFYLALFQLMFSNPDLWAKSPQGPPPPQVMAIFHGFIMLFVLWFLAGAIGNLLSGLFIRRRRHRVFSMVVAGLNCMHIPLGTILGIFTFIVLARDSVRTVYVETQGGAREVVT